MRATAALVVVVLAVAGCSADDGSATSVTASTNGSSATSVATTTTAPPPPATTASTSGLSTTSVATNNTAPPPATTVSATPCGMLATGVNRTTLDAGGGTHSVQVFVPTSFAGSPLPVVIDWHGLGSDGLQQAAYSDYEVVAEEEGFIVVHPTGLADTRGDPNSWQLYPTPGSGRDDLAFAGALIDELIAQWCADPGRVYSTGMSNGGFFTARLICEMPDRIAAAVSVAGTFHPAGCHPSRDLPYMAIHGTADKVVPYLGGGESTLAGPDADPSWRVFFEQVIPDEFAEFAADAGCEPTTVDSSIGEDVVRHEYTDCAEGVPMIFDEVQGGGHTWPSSPLASLTGGVLGYTTDDIDATRDGWAFMSQFTLSTPFMSRSVAGTGD